MPPLITLTISIVQLAIKAAPYAKQLYEDAHRLFDMWFAAGLISADYQNKLHTWSDAHEAAVIAGEIPPELVVEPDPV